ncbi:MFS transporter [Ancylobacter sp. 6x-1]|uniref:MFS transporter n=1 Tax=Ancylobacter crimeensis TaxID=2579147 RepID=A0ABT0D9Z6_9HYPH|nr:MFS transporter [Ancylobacter crimeensis]MCK0196783.1 MFS transporter [Ancylobacter crimeensis]
MAQTLGPVASLLLGVFFLVSGSGLQGTLLPLRGAYEGFSAVNLGILGSSYYLGFVAGCLIVPRLVRRAGHIRSFAALTAGAIAAMLAHAIFFEPVVWFVLRTITGFCFAGLYLVIESWLNDRATNKTRGLVMSVYVMVDYVALTVGQMLVTVYPVKGFEPFALATMLFALAMLPVTITKAGQPSPIEAARIRPMRLLKAAPVAMVGCFIIGLTNGSLWSLGPIFGIGRGLTADGAATFMSAVVAAGALAQWPIGRFSDRMDRRIMLSGLLGGAALAGLALGLVPASVTGLTLLCILGALFGSLALPAYSLTAAHAYDRTPPQEAVETAAGVLLAYGIGSIAGPSVASVTMAHYGPGTLFLFTAACHASFMCFVLWNLRRERSAKTVAPEMAPAAPVGMVGVPEPETRMEAPPAGPAPLSGS